MFSDSVYLCLFNAPLFRGACFCFCMCDFFLLKPCCRELYLWVLSLIFVFIPISGSSFTVGPTFLLLGLKKSSLPSLFVSCPLVSASLWHQLSLAFFR